MLRNSKREMAAAETKLLGNNHILFLFKNFIKPYDSKIGSTVSHRFRNVIVT